MLGKNRVCLASLFRYFNDNLILTSAIMTNEKIPPLNLSKR